MAEIKITKENFRKEVLESDIPVLLDFWATWCAPCLMLAPEIEETAKEYEGKIKVCKINVDEENEIASAFQVSSIPLIVVMNKGEIKKSAVGYRKKDEIEELFINEISL